MNKIVYILILLASFISAQTGNIKGTVTDGTNPIPGVNLILTGTGFGTASDTKGNYELRNIPSEDYELKASAVGYETKILNVRILSGRTIVFNISLKQGILETKEIEVTGFRRQEQKDTRTSLIDLSPRSAKILPGAGEDVLRTLQSLPGVLAPNDFSSQLIVRGSGPDQNLIIMDDVEIFNPYRLYGVVSMFNPDAVSNVNLVSGGFPARYGDRLSAVLDVTNKEGTRKKSFTGSLNASIIDANLVLEGKAPFGIAGSWLVNSRRTYYDLIIEPFVKKTGLVQDNVQFPSFYDVQGKIVIGPYNGSKFLFNGIFSRDNVDIVSGPKRTTADSISISNLTKNDVASFAWHYAPSDDYLNKFIVSWYRNGGAADFQSEILDPSLDRNNFKNILPDTLSPYLLNFKFNTDFTFRKYAVDDIFTYIWGKNIFEAGAGVDFMQTIINFSFQVDPQLLAFFNSNPQMRSSLSSLKDENNDKKYRTYIQNNFAVTDKLYIQGGLRFDYYDVLRKAYLAPRISMSYALDDLTTIRGVFGIYYQSPGYEKLRDQNVLYDLSPSNTENLQAEKALHYVLGIERWLTSEWNLRVEGYYKNFSNLINPEIVQGTKYIVEPVPGKNKKYVNGWTLPVTINGDSVTQVPVNNSDGFSYGLEFFLSKKNVMNLSNLSGWISYSLAFASVNDRGTVYPFRYDQRNTINVVLNYSLNSWLDAGVRWQYGSGFPVSEPVGIKPRIINTPGVGPAIATRKAYNNPGAPEEVIFDIDYGGNKLNSRLPSYQRLDIRLTALTDFWGLNWAFYLDVINVYNRKNVVGYRYFVNPDLSLGREVNTMFPIIPTFGVSIKF